MQAVSTLTGALGIDPAICSGKLTLAADDDWTTFANSVMTNRHADGPQGALYYAHFFWGSIAARAAAVLA